MIRPLMCVPTQTMSGPSRMWWQLRTLGIYHVIGIKEEINSLNALAIKYLSPILIQRVNGGWEYN